MSDNNIKTNVTETVGTAENSGETLEQAVAEYIEKSGETPTNNGGDERILELYQKVAKSDLPDVEKDNLSLNLLEEWRKIIGDISEKANPKNEQPEPSIGYILSQLELIRSDNEHIKEALNVLLTMHNGDSGDPGSPGNVLGEAKANAIRDVVVHREATNQKLIEFYTKLYDDIKPAKPNKEPALEIISNVMDRDFSDMDPEQIDALVKAISYFLDGVRHIDH